MATVWCENWQSTKGHAISANASFLVQFEAVQSLQYAAEYAGKTMANSVTIE